MIVLEVVDVKREILTHMTALRLATSLLLGSITLAASLARGQEALDDAAPDFETEVIPILTKAGCNSGSCHGAAIGRGGFKLSLLGYDPVADFDSLVNEFEGRRVNLAHPENSLVLRKPSLDIDHEGGSRINPAGDAYQILQAWIRAGVPHARDRILGRIEVSPKAKWLAQPGDKFSIKVLGYFRQGDEELVRDVTRWSLITVSDAMATRVGSRGEITAVGRGRSSVMVRFLGEVAAVTVAVPIGEGIPQANRPRTNFIDDHVNRTLDDLQLPQSTRSDDATFARRVFLDLIGTLPNPEELEEFLHDARSEKRALLVDRLMTRPEFVDLWSYKWGDLLRIESRRLQPQGAAAFHRWIHDCVAQDKPLDVMAREMILGIGDSYTVGPANFHRVPNDASGEAEHVSRVFLGVRLQCANCHNHPLDRWTQDDYHGLAATFARIDRGRAVRPLERGEVIHPKTGRTAAPKIPGGISLGCEPDKARELFASWLTAPDNAFFARAAANRIWRELMGRGLVEPIDDHRATNPATHPELLDALVAALVSEGFHARPLIRTIIASEAYQRSARSVPGNGTDDRFYSRYLLRSLPPHVHVDIVAKLTGVPESLGDTPAGTSATSLGDSRIPSEPLDLLGRCSRDGDCSAAGSSGGSLPLTLHTINGAWLNAKITQRDGLVQRTLHESDTSFIDHCYRRALSRSPTPEERVHWTAQLAVERVERRIEVRQDFLWALLNSTEFCCNH